jgi:tetratricopeptide (TPR) repeat protein
MDRLSRRDLLAAISAFAAGILLPLDVRRAGLNPEELEAQATVLARRIEMMECSEHGIDSPSVALGAAQTHFDTIRSALDRTIRSHQRVPLHRAASTMARVCALASRCSQIDAHQWLTIAEAEAKAANDGPLLAHASMERAWAEGMAERFADCPCPKRLTLVTTALSRTGIGDEQSSIRAWARQERAWELALTGDRHDALVELDMATMEAQRAGWRDPSIHEMVGSTLRKLRRPVEAERSLSRALDQRPYRRIWVHCEVAQVHLALNDADAAAGSLEEAFLLTRAQGMSGRLPRILAVRAMLPPGRAARELDEVMHST